MPGPRNHPLQRKCKPGPKVHKELKTKSTANSYTDVPACATASATEQSTCSSSPSPDRLLTPRLNQPPPTLPFCSKEPFLLSDDVGNLIDNVLSQQPYIYDPGNGPRVRNARAFVQSSFAQPPALHNPLCAEFAQVEVLQMLSTALPDEAATILWYNKSRATSRVCPACQRLYRLGDTLPDHLDENSKPRKFRLPQLQREQEMSGLCSPMCFIIASFNFPNAIKTAWGRMADELDDATWALLNEPGENTSQIGRTLGMIVKMTRLYDLGLSQLCFGDENGIEDTQEEYAERSSALQVIT